MTDATAADADRAVQRGARGLQASGPARLRRPGQGAARVRGGVRSARRRADADPRRRAGQDDPRGEDRAAQGRGHARALRRAAEEVRGISVHSLDPGVEAACCAGRSASSRRSCRGTSRRRCCATSSAPRFWRQHRRRQAGGHDAVHDAAAGRDLPRGRAAAGRAQRRPGRGRRGRARRSSSHPRVRKVAFTGSTPVGERVHALAAEGSKRVTLELGGSDPMIICDDADLARAASAAAMGRFYNCGQACLAIKRVYVFESVADEVIEAIAAKAERLRVGIGTDPDPSSARCTPSASARAWSARSPRAGERSSPAAGAPTAWTAGGSTSRRSSLEPGRDSPMAREEVFGPGAADLARARTSTRRSSWPTTRRSGSARRVWTREPGHRRARRRRARLRLHVDQLADEGLRRAAVRRPEGLGLRQGARLRSARLLHRHEVGRGQTGAVGSHFSQQAQEEGESNDCRKATVGATADRE